MKLTRRNVLKAFGGGVAASAIGFPMIAKSAEPITVGTIKVPHWAGVWGIPDHMPAGKPVNLVEFKTSLEMIAAFIAGSLEIATIGYWHAVRMMDQGSAITCLAGVCSLGSRVVVRKGLAVANWKDLRGKTCAVARGSTQDLQFLLALKNNGLSMSDIQYRDLGGNMAVHISALEQKQVDTSSMWEPFASKVLIQEGAKELPGLYEGSFTANGIMVVKPDLISKKRDAVQSVVTAHVKSTDALLHDPKMALETSIKLSGFDRDTMVLANKNTALEYRLRKIDAHKIAAVAKEVGYAKTDVSSKIDSSFDYSFLEAATGMKAAELGD